MKVASSKDVCFQYGPDMSCISEVDKNIDDILAKQLVFAKNITKLKEDLVNTIGEELRQLQIRTRANISALESIVEANKGASLFRYLIAYMLLFLAFAG